MIRLQLYRVFEMYDRAGRSPTIAADSQIELRFETAGARRTAFSNAGGLIQPR